MKILLVSLNFSPELTGIGKFSGEMAQGLVERGHEVAVVCAPPFYPQWRVAVGHRAWAYRVERPQPGLTVLRCPVWVPSRRGGFARLLHLASFALSSLPQLLWMAFWRPRAVLVVAPALFSAPGAWLVARLSGAKAWLHVQDFEVDAAFALGLLPRTRLRRWALAVESFVMRRFDTVSTISQPMLRQLAHKGVPPQRAELVPNWADLDALHPLERDHADALRIRRKLGIDAGRLVCLYSGTFNRKQGLEMVVEAARRLADDPRLMFVLCGNGELRDAIESSARGLHNVRFLDLQPAAELNALLAMADIHMLTQLRGAADLVMPSKLVGMLASGRAIVATAAPGTEVANVVAVCGRVSEPESLDGFVSAIRSLADDEHERLRCGMAARAQAQGTLDAKTILDRLSSSLEAGERIPRASVGARHEPELIDRGRPTSALQPMGSGVIRASPGAE